MSGQLTMETELDKELANLRARISELETVINISPAMTFRWRVADGWPVEFASESVSQLGYSADDFVSGRVSWPGITLPEDCARLEKEVGDILAAGGSEFHNEYRLITKSGEVRWIADRNRVIRDRDGNVTHIQGVAMDITERRETESELKGSQKMLRSLAKHLQSAVEAERTRVSRQVHDDLGQALTGLRMDLAWLARRLQSGESAGGNCDEILEKVDQMFELIDSTAVSVRELCTELRPGILDDLGLEAAVEWGCERFSERTGIECVHRLRLHENQPDDLVATAFFRILQECFTNIFRHAAAQSVSIQLNAQNGMYVLVVKDDGKGITEEDANSQQSIGLIGMRERAHAVGGEIQVCGEEGRGTTVTATVPIQRIPAADEESCL